MIGRGVLLSSNVYPGSTTTVPVTVTTDMAPKTEIIAWFETKQHEIVSDSITLSISDIFKNKVSIFVLLVFPI